MSAGKILVIVMLVSSIASSQTVRNVPGTYPTIVDAVNNASSGDTILVGPGVYSEQLVIRKDLVLIGSGEENTILREAEGVPDSTILVIDSATVALRDMQFYGGGNWAGGKRGIVALGATTMVRRCAFVVCYNVSVAAINGSLDMDSVLITCVWGGSTLIIDSCAQYLGMASDLGVLAVNAHFSIDHFTAGAYIDHIVDIRPDLHSIPTFLGTDYPVDTSQFPQGVIQNSTFFGSRTAYYGQGIRIIGAMNRHQPELAIRNNRFVGQVKDSTDAVPDMLTTAGISFNGWNGYAEISGNTIHNFNTGIFFHGVATANVYDNAIVNNGRYGVITTSGMNVVQPDLGGGPYGSPGRNTIANNGKYNIDNLNSQPVWAYNNDWGTTDSTRIDSLLFDDNENPGAGEVYYCANTLGIAHMPVGKPKALWLSDNYPNPFNPGTTIRFALAAKGKVSLKIFDISGREVATLLDGEREGGVEYTVAFNAMNLSSGVYFCRLSAGGSSATRRILLLR